MAGVKGRSGGPRANSGGARKGAGRKKKPAPALDAPKTESPLEFLVGVMNDAGADARLRVRAAVAAAQYLHAKQGEGGKKDAADRAAGSAATGKFAPAAPPRLVVNNTKR